MNAHPNDTIDKLNHLISHHRVTLEVCDAAAMRLPDLDERAEVRRMVDDHLRHVDELSRCVESLGGKPAVHKADMPVDRSEVRQREKAERVLGAILADEEQMAQVYGEVEISPKAEEKVSGPLSRAVSSIDRHRSWLRDRLQN